MKEAIQYLDEYVRKLGEHPLYQWTTTTPFEDARRHYDSFIPLLGFVMTFRYYNEMYLRYDPEAEADADADADALPALTRVINDHVREDRTHVRLFLGDMRRLGIDEVWRLQTPSSLLWTIWVSPMLDDVRAALSKRVEAIVAHEDAWPVYRYLHMEQIERDGNLLFSAVNENTDRVIAQRGAEPVYFGDYHLERETGHVGNDDHQTATTDVALSADELTRSRRIIEYKHALSMQMNDAMYQYVQAAETSEHSADPLLAEQADSLAHLRRRVDDHAAGRVAEPRWNIRPDVYTEQSDLIAAWYRHHADFVNHPFAALMRAAKDDDPGFALRVAALLMANRITALHTFYLHDCQVADPAADGAREVDFIAKTFSTEAEMFFHDWDALGMDARIPWPAADMLEWWFLDRTYGRPELETLHEWRRQTLRVHDPIGKYWAIMSVHIMSRAFFGCVQPLARRFAEANPDAPRLVYFENTHHLLYDRVVAAYAEPDHPTSLGHLPVDDAQRATALAMMDAFARFGKRQFDNIARALTTDREAFAFLRG